MLALPATCRAPFAFFARRERVYFLAQGFDQGSRLRKRRVPLFTGRAAYLQNLEKEGLFRRSKTLGEYLKKRRRELGLLQQEAAKQLGVVSRH